MFLPFSIVFDNFFGYCFIKCSKELVPPLCPHAINSSCVKALQLSIESLLKYSYIHPPPVPTGLCIFEVFSTSARKMATTMNQCMIWNIEILHHSSFLEKVYICQDDVQAFWGGRCASCRGAYNVFRLKGGIQPVQIRKSRVCFVQRVYIQVAQQNDVAAFQGFQHLLQCCPKLYSFIGRAVKASHIQVVVANLHVDPYHFQSRVQNVS